MKTIRVEATIHAPVEAVFDLITDHARYRELPNVSDSSLLRRGQTDENGTGAVREIRSNGLRFEEEITAFERPSYFEYRIIKSTLPIRHDGGRMTFTAVDGGTHIEWVTTFRLKIPVIGGLATLPAARSLDKAFSLMLASWRDRLEADATAQPAPA